MSATRDDRVVDPTGQPDDELDRSLRPRRLGDFLGQDRIVRQLEVYVAAARGRGEACDHVLLAGPPGLGKTSLATIVANEMGSQIRTISGPALEKKGDIAAILTALEPRDVLFIDEIHRTPRAIEELLYPAMEDGAIDLVIGSGPGARTLRIELSPFTLIGATTRAGLLTTPLRDRFGMHFRLDHYERDDLGRIVVRSAAILGIEIRADAVDEIARRARGTPRIANRILRRVRDYAQVRGHAVVDREAAALALDLLELDADGLDHMDRVILRTIGEKFTGGPVGLSTLAVALGEDAGSIEDVYEPYLIQQGLIQRTARGRMLTPRGRELVRLPPEPSPEPLFP